MKIGKNHVPTCPIFADPVTVLALNLKGMLLLSVALSVIGWCQNHETVPPWYLTGHYMYFRKTVYY